VSKTFDDWGKIQYTEPVDDGKTPGVPQEWQPGHRNTLTAFRTRMNDLAKGPGETGIATAPDSGEEYRFLRGSKHQQHLEPVERRSEPWVDLPAKEADVRAGSKGDPRVEVFKRELGQMQAFSTGATRSDDSYKPDPEGFFSPLVIAAYAEYMQEQRLQDDGRTRASDNWQKGIPFHKYMKSLWRHFLDLWKLHRGYVPKPEMRHGRPVPVTMEKALAGIMFNTMGYFHEYLMDREAWENRQISDQEDVDDKVRTIHHARKQKAA
jgi:hypothetical protein